MTSPLFSSAISPRKIISEGSETRSLAGGKLAQLVSKFEFLDAVSSVGNSPHGLSKPNLITSVTSPSIVGQTPSRLPKISSQQSTNARERSSIDSHLSSNRFTTSSQEPILARRVQTFGTKSPATPSKSVDIKSRQKSVSERRNIFETANQQAGLSVSPRASLVPRPPSRLAHSKSWRSLKSRCSAAQSSAYHESTDHDPNTASKTRSPTSRFIPSPRTLLASDDPFVKWRSPLTRPDDSWTSFKRSNLATTAPDASPSYIRSQYTEVSPQIDKRPSAHDVKFESVRRNDPVQRQAPTEENRHHGWVRHAQKIASSLSNTVYGGTSSTQNKSLTSPDLFDQGPFSKNDIMSFKLTSTRSTSRSKLPHSKISGFRKRLEQSKERPSVAFALGNKKRHESVPTTVGAPISSLELPLLKSFSSSESEVLNTPKIRSKSHTPCRSQTPMRSLQNPVGRRNTEKNDSPLKQKISLFESLERRNSASNDLHVGIDSQQAFVKPDKHERRDSIIAPLRSFPGKLRRISTSCRRTPSEWSTTSSRDVGNSTMQSSDTSLVAQEEQIVTATAEEPLSPHTIDPIPLQPILKQTFLTNEISPLVLEKPLSFPRASVARTGFNIDGEAGPGIAPLPLFAEPQRRFSRTKHVLSRAANRVYLPDTETEFELLELLEDNLKCVSEESPPISNARCLLEQPRPVRANELRRLVSMCKDKVRKISGGRSE
ncbi:hypothetical protein FVEN_g10215 [Fusarium venenatum]|uniref:Uncharacterized protein n=1 Tax=Fusarium venenatum TaxID=56646 RepID=A0A2L2TZE0_9HYPO|nr:uncharacterized protein FVRRES_03097 [Fusarium venenatum]KAG8351743.1 hypothetical protein FVEN_g10215 [Fusarium venenatum]CEI66585.1 unnamed protein product [Fusarium venenatum]